MKKKIPIVSIVFLTLWIITMTLYIVSIMNGRFADSINTGFSQVLRRITASISGVFPFSLAELLILSSPFLAVFFIVFLIVRIKRDKSEFLRLGVIIISVIAFVDAMFILTFGIGYHTTPLDKKMDLDSHEVSADDLYETINIVIDEINALSPSFTAYPDLGTVMPYTVEECSTLCTKSFSALGETEQYIDSFACKVKRIAMSEYMTYTHISGFYSFYTGEANINTNYPYFVIPYTVAHEMAHQRGIARENEANFIAYLACIGSDDEYLKYSGYLNMFEYLGEALYSASPELYRTAVSSLSYEARYDLYHFSVFFDKYRENTAADVSETVNNAYLQSQGTVEGTRSYGLVVDLTVAYYKNGRNK